jgi:hypothetical protein
LNEAVEWNGADWSLVKLPDPAGKGADADSELNAIACASSRDCWAGGFYSESPSGPNFNQVLHWDGTTWQAIVVPSPKTMNTINGVACPTQNDCWAVGSSWTANQSNQKSSQNEILHWDGSGWLVAA